MSEPRGLDAALALTEAALRERYRLLVARRRYLWRGDSRTIDDLMAGFSGADKRTRERIWRTVADRRLQDAGEVDTLWEEMCVARSGHADAEACEDIPRWSAPDFHLAVEEFATAALTRLHESRRQLLGLRSLRPWDLMTAHGGLPVADLECISRRPEAMLERLALLALTDDFERTMYRSTSGTTSCGGRWASLWLRFLPSVDWTGLDQQLALDWQAREDLFLRPFSTILEAHELLSGVTLDRLPPETTLSAQNIREVVERLEEEAEDTESE